VPAKAISRLRKTLLALDQRERLELPGLDPRRADLSVAVSCCSTPSWTCSAPKRSRSRTWHCARASCSTTSSATGPHRAHRPLPDIRRRSVIELAERSNYLPEHAQQVARLALQVFDQTRAQHGLGPREREWLEFAALLHDIGMHISYEGTTSTRST